MVSEIFTQKEIYKYKPKVHHASLVTDVWRKNKRQTKNQRLETKHDREGCVAPPIGEKGWILDLPIVHYGLGLAGAERRHRAVVAVVYSRIHNSTD